MLRLTLCLFLAIFCFRAHAQNTALSSWGNRMDSTLQRYGERFEPTRLYLHTDKNIYTSDETVWFSAYLWSVSEDSFRHRVLFVSLIRESDDSLVRHTRFLIDDRRASGNLQLPGSLKAGNYRLLAYTDKLADRKPAVVYQQLLLVKSEAPLLFRVKASILPSSRTDSTWILLQALDKKDEPLRGALCSYEVRSGNRKRATGREAFDTEGELRIAMAGAVSGRLSLSCGIALGLEKEKLELRVLPSNRNFRLSFYPESGDIVAGATARVAVEARTSFGEPVSGNIRLYRNGQELAVFHTDLQGYGLLQFGAEKGVRYSARAEFQDSTWSFDLPQSREAGYSLQLPRSIVSDSLSFFVQSSVAGMQLRFLVHNFRAAFLLGTVRTPGTAAMTTCALPELARGVYALTLIDSLERPVCERLFFVDHREERQVYVKSERSNYATREKVRVDLGADTASVKYARLSLSVVHANRLSSEYRTSIVTELLLRDELEGALPFLSELCNDSLNHPLLQNLLLTKGWRRYHWEDYAKGGRRPLIATLQPGRGKLVSSRVDPPYEFMLLNGGRFDSFLSDSLGFFTIDPQFMTGRENRKLVIVPVRVDRKQIWVVPDTLADHVRKASPLLPRYDYETIRNPVTTSDNNSIRAPDGSKVLSTVIVSTNSRGDRFTSKDCNDYVCQYNILNCPNHHFGSPPEEGEFYSYFDPVTRRSSKVQYFGCGAIRAEQKKFLTVEGIAIGKEFYKSDYEKQPMTEPEYFTTLYWNPRIPLRNGQFTDTFFTNDGKGLYIGILEGLLNGEPIHREFRFTVQ